MCSKCYWKLRLGVMKQVSFSKSFFANCLVRVISGAVFSSMWTYVMLRTTTAYSLLRVTVPAPGNVPEYCSLC